MKIILTLLLSAFLFNGSTLKEVRSAFRDAENTMEEATTFNQLMSKDLDIDSNLKTAYYGASEAMMAKHGGSISQRISLFKSGKGYIETAIKNSPSNVEIRLVRLMVQYNAPSILGYYSAIDTDKKFIIEHFHSVTSSLKNYIKEIAKNTDIFTVEEKSRLK